ncbi:FirrV-1-B48 [Feldmannia irregularis virus a]|uniref:Sulfhydryl oxidase n=1 Tax=Feldmannia irregularis virus a TaxID=231992 RepID=Q6XLY8_9PHYC|nr:FirrV-1-B48 [Feldmannia irregularis virus a]AAR26923.1 FirrV-1-B48 [Feldmannia irregularis virus a]
MTTNVSTTLWGPHGWKFLHYVAHGCPDHPSHEEIQKYVAFFTSLQDVLPCTLCRNSYSSYLITNPIRANTKKDLCRWLWEIHNMVNAKLGVTYRETDFGTVYARYEAAAAAATHKPFVHGVLLRLVVFIPVVYALFFLVKMVKYRNFYLSR